MYVELILTLHVLDVFLHLDEVWRQGGPSLGTRDRPYVNASRLQPTCREKRLGRVPLYDALLFLRSFQHTDQTAVPPFPYVEFVIVIGRCHYILSGAAECDVIPGASIDDILELVLDRELYCVRVEVLNRKVRQVKRFDNLILTINQKLSSRAGQLQRCDDSAAYPGVSVYDLLCLRINDVEVALVGAGKDMLARLCVYRDRRHVSRVVLLLFRFFLFVDLRNGPFRRGR